MADDEVTDDGPTDDARGWEPPLAGTEAEHVVGALEGGGGPARRLAARQRLRSGPGVRDRTVRQLDGV